MIPLIIAKNVNAYVGAVSFRSEYLKAMRVPLIYLY